MEEENYKGFKDEKQKEYYERTKSFLELKNKILVNPGGMGLGKTWATIKALKDMEEWSFISCPTSPLKNVWSNDFNKSQLNGKYMIWFSKEDCCIKKKENKNFNVQKDCNDDCDYRNKLETQGDLEVDGKIFYEEIKPILPFYPSDYYKKDCSRCLLSPSRYGLKNEKYIIGDYFGFLNSKMFDMVVNRKGIINKNKQEGILIIDEAHLLPSRAKDYLSKTISFSNIINQLEKEYQCDFIIKKNINLIDSWENTIKTLRNIEEYIIKNKKEEQERFTYDNFIDLYLDLFETNSFEPVKELSENLIKLYRKDDNQNGNENESNDDPATIRFNRFLNMWYEKQNDITYKTKFQYRNINKGKINFIIDCCDTSSFLSNLFDNWKKILLNSGTISDIERFNFDTGINKFSDTIYKPIIESYPIKDNILLYSIGNFTSQNRIIEYKNQSQLLNKTLELFEGRTIIYIQNKSASRELLNIINGDKKIIDFCSKDDGFQTNKQDFEQLEKEFNSSKESIAIMNINGRVEGFNFENIFDGTSVKNIIILGYPFPFKGLSYQDQLQYYTEKIKNPSTAKKWMNYSLVLDRIHQAVCRSKRSISDKPIIILWDRQFGIKENAYKFMPDDLKGKLIYEESKLISEIKEMKNDRNL